METAGPIAFGPDGILFLADNAAARVLAVDVEDSGPEAGGDPFDVENVDIRVADHLGCGVSDLNIRDVAVHPLSQNVYLSVQRGRGDSGQAVVVRVDRVNGSVSDVVLDGVQMSEVSMDDAPPTDDERVDVTLPLGEDEGEELQIGDRKLRILRRPIRTSTVTDMSFVDGVLLVAGLSNEEFSSRLRQIPFPFGDGRTRSSLEIYHVSHGKWETEAPIRAFAPYDGGRSIVASYTCTPVVHFPMSDLIDEQKVVGRTVAELGPMNQPLDLISFMRDGEEHVLVANSAHGLIRIAGRDIDTQVGLTNPREPVGVPREREDLEGITCLANLNDDHVLALQTDGQGAQHLRSFKTSSL
jgi:hypothetical protein